MNTMQINKFERVLIEFKNIPSVNNFFEVENRDLLFILHLAVCKYPEMELSVKYLMFPNVSVYAR